MAVTYTPIATQTLGSAVASVTFSSISGTYTDLIVVFNGGETVANGITIKINSDTGSNYSQTRLVGNGTTAASNRRTSITSVYLDDGITFDTNAGNNNSIVHFMNYSNSTTYKTWLQRSNNAGSGTIAGVGLWRNTSAITAIEFSISGSTMVVGTSFTLYGIKAA